MPSKYKLINTDTGAVLTTGDDASIRFGGPWGDLQAAGLAEWVDNTPTLEELKAEKLSAFKAQATALLSSTDYKALKFVDGAISQEEYTPFRFARQAIRDHFNDLEAAINSAESLEELEALVW